MCYIAAECVLLRVIFIIHILHQFETRHENGEGEYKINKLCETRGEKKRKTENEQEKEEVSIDATSVASCCAVCRAVCVCVLFCYYFEMMGDRKNNAIIIPAV